MTASRYEGEAPAAVAVDRYGDTLLAWAAFNENLVNGYPCYHQIQVRVRTRAGKLGPLLTLTPKGTGTATVSVAISPSGQAVAAWIQVGGGSSVQARYIGMNNVLGPVRTIGSAQPDTPGLVIGRNGVATVTWSDGSFQRPVARRLTLNAVGPLTAIMPAAANTTYSVPQIADDTNGDTIFLIRRIGHTATAQPTYLHVREWYRGGKLGTARQLATQVEDWRLATDGAGDSLAVWNKYVGSGQPPVYARRISRTGALGSTARLGLGYVPAITVDPAGRGLVAWQSTPANTQGL